MNAHEEARWLKGNEGCRWSLLRLWHMRHWSLDPIIWDYIPKIDLEGFIVTGEPHDTDILWLISRSAVVDGATLLMSSGVTIDIEGLEFRCSFADEHLYDFIVQRSDLSGLFPRAPFGVGQGELFKINGKVESRLTSYEGDLKARLYCKVTKP